MDQEEIGSVSAHYSIHTDAENGGGNSEGQGYEWQSTVSGRSMLSRRSFAVSKEKRNSCKVVFVVAIVGVAVALMSLPAIIHPFLFRVANSTNATEGGGICDTIDWQASPGQSGCKAMPYDSGVCYDQLADWQECVTGQSISVTINSSSDINQLMTDAKSAISDLSVLGSAECQQVAVPFLCAYLFPLCDNGTLYLPTSQECFNLSTNVCASEWSLALASRYSYLLPNCSELPGQSLNSTINNSTNISCAEGFFVSGSACIPSCGEWSQFSNGSTLWQNIVIGMLATFGFICGILVLIGSCIRHSVMCRFPYIFLVLMSVSFCVLAVQVVLSVADRTLYCTSDNIYNALANSSVFCIISGASFHYFLPNLTLFWLFHISSMFIKLFLPHWSRRHPHLQMSINVGFLILALVLPIPAVLWTVVEYQYIMFSFPPLFCFPSNIHLYYFSVILLVNILLVIGVALYILLFWKLHSLHSKVALSSGRWDKWVAFFVRQKIMIFTSYYFLLGIFVLITFEIDQQAYPDLMQNIMAYFACELNGSSNSCSEAYMKYNHVYISNIAYVLLSLPTFFHLIYVINWKYVLQKFCKRHPDQAQLVMTDEQNSSTFTPNAMEVHGSSFTSTM